ncbi:MAG: hypothetical protein DI527_07830 [Chelatococcus sp.]|nr:MAG: hypothetical protein DI527_07830 [Chelatococcus sp.]
MLSSRLRFGRAALVAGCLALALGACGRKGPLEPPPAATNAIDLPASQIGGVESDAASLSQASVLAKPPKANKKIEVPDVPFVLDPLM